MGCFLWCIALLCPMDRAFLARRLIVPVDSLIVSVDSLIVLGEGIRGVNEWLFCQRKIPYFFCCGVGRECEFYELGELSEFGGRWEGSTNLANFTNFTKFF